MIDYDLLSWMLDGTTLRQAWWGGFFAHMGLWVLLFVFRMVAKAAHGVAPSEKESLDTD